METAVVAVASVTALQQHTVRSIFIFIIFIHPLPEARFTCSVVYSYAVLFSSFITDSSQTIFRFSPGTLCLSGVCVCELLAAVCGK